MAAGTAPLTKAQRTLLQEAQAIADLTKLDISDLEEIDNQFRLVHLRMAINRMVVAEIVIRYTLIDEILSDLIARYYFKVPKKSIHFQKLWRTKKFSTFTHHILDEIFLIKKMALVHAIKPLSKDVTSAIHRVNTIRNAFAHSFFPENRKEHRKNKKVLYNGKDIRTYEGIEAFIDDAHTAFNYLARRAFGRWTK